MTRALLYTAPIGIVVLLLLLLLGCGSRPASTERERIRECITSGEPATTDDWLALTLECTE